MAQARRRSSRKPARAKKSARRAPKKRSAPKKRAAAKKRSGSRRKAAAKKKPAAPKRAAAPSLAGLAQKIIRLTQGPSFGAAEIRELYNPDATSVEANGQTAVGYAGLEDKMKGWEQMAAAMSSRAANVWTGPHTVCIEWDSTVTMRDGRTVQLREVAVHEIRNGRIQNERYFYDPTALAPPSAPGGLPPTA